MPQEDNGGNKITEKWEYKTSILTAYNGTEQRIKTRQYPRHFVSYDYDAMDAYQGQWLRAQNRVRQNVPYYVPMWQNVAYIDEEYKKNAKQLIIKPEYMFGFQDCEYIEIFTADDVTQAKANVVRKVVRYIDNAIVLKKGIPMDMHKSNCFVFPLKNMSTLPTENLDYVFSNGSNTVLNFEDILEIPNINISSKYIYDDDTGIEDWNPFNLPKTYDGLEVFLFTPTWANDSDFGLSVSKNANKLDNTTGVYKYDLKNDKSYDTIDWELKLLCKKEINRMIKFFKRQSGKFKSFFCPSWVNDVQYSKEVPAGQNYIYTEFNGMTTYYLSNGRQKNIVIFNKDFSSDIYTIVGYTNEDVDGIKYCKIMLSSALKKPIGKNTLMISYFNRVRFDTDELQLNYSSNIVATANLTFKEVDIVL